MTFPDIPEAITDGDSEEEAMEYVVDAIESMLTIYIRRRREIPRPSKARGKQMRMVVVPVLSEAKIRLYEAMRAGGLRKADLARRLKLQKSRVDRLLDLNHKTRLEQIQKALADFCSRSVPTSRDSQSQALYTELPVLA